jgi:hypothetical protein
MSFGQGCSLRFFTRTRSVVSLPASNVAGASTNAMSAANAASGNAWAAEIRSSVYRIAGN